MTTNPIFLIAVLLNTIIAFYTATFFVECILIFCRVKKHRTRATLRLFPFLAVIIDRIFSEFSMVNWLNPLSCNSCIQKFLLQTLFPDVMTHLSTKELSLTSYLGSDIPNGWSLILFIAFCSITLGFFLYKLCHVYFQYRLLNSIIQNGSICPRSIGNAQLASALEDHQVKIIVSDQIHVPMAAYNTKIIMPKMTMTEISQEEFESIIAHELEHLRWKDPLSRLGMQLVSALFWWIPIQGWQKKIHHDQEMACDSSVLIYGMDSESLASSLIKFTKQAKVMSHRVFCSFADKKSISIMRLEAMFGILPTNKLLSSGLIGFGLETSLFLICAF